MKQAFKHVSLDNTTVEFEFVVCMPCRRTVACKKKDGTKGMITHKCAKEESQSTQKQHKLTVLTKKADLQGDKYSTAFYIYRISTQKYGTQI